MEGEKAIFNSIYGWVSAILSLRVIFSWEVIFNIKTSNVLGLRSSLELMRVFGIGLQAPSDLEKKHALV